MRILYVAVFKIKIQIIHNIKITKYIYSHVVGVLIFKNRASYI
jgi:hypothetical protein